MRENLYAISCSCRELPAFSNYKISITLRIFTKYNRMAHTNPNTKLRFLFDSDGVLTAEKSLKKI